MWCHSKRMIVSWSLVTLLTGTCALVLPVQAEHKDGDHRNTLYQRLGGYDAISAVVNEFANRLFKDPKLEAFFGNWSPEKQARFKQLNALLVCSATGGPCTYIGRTMTASHQGMRIDNARFDQVAGHLGSTLDKFKVPKAEKDELLGIIGGLRPEIVGK